jgi:TRAP-type C4-dicarboxylate transport system substrate-binding protein
MASSKIFVEMLNKAGKGKVRIDYLGGPEVIPTFDQVQATRTGVVDLSFNVAGFYEDQMPAAHIFLLSKLTPMEERKAGLYDYVQPLHGKNNLYLLGRYAAGFPFYIHVNKKVETPNDLAKKRIRTASSFDRFLKALKIATVPMAAPDVYTALERGTIDGFTFPDVGVVNFGWHEVTKFYIDHPFYETNQVTIFNLDSWNKLPANVQDLLTKVQIEFEPVMYEFNKKQVDAERQKMSKAGMQFIKFSEADAKRYTDLAYNVKWQQLREKASPEVYNRLRELVQQ